MGCQMRETNKATVVPPHCGVSVNTTDEALAKERTQTMRKPNCKNPFISTKLPGRNVWKLQKPMCEQEMELSIDIYKNHSNSITK